jgi:hypothetical protein
MLLHRRAYKRSWPRSRCGFARGFKSVTTAQFAEKGKDTPELREKLVEWEKLLESTHLEEYRIQCYINAIQVSSCDSMPHLT